MTLLEKKPMSTIQATQIQEILTINVSYIFKNNCKICFFLLMILKLFSLFNLDSYNNEKPKENKHYEYDSSKDPSGKQANNDGGVTIVSARPPARTNLAPTTANRSQPYQPQPTKYSFQSPQQNNQAKVQLPYSSYSQRIDNSSAPLQLPNRSNLDSNNHSAKDGATDV